MQSECTARGIKILAEAALDIAASVTTVRRSGGARVVSGGPYAAYEGLGGFYFVDTPHLDLPLELSDFLPPYDMELRPVDPLA